jgi:uncharacterized membrane protein
MSDTKVLTSKSAFILSAVAVFCLVSVGLLFTWTAALAVVLVELLLCLGYWLASERLSTDRERIERERAALDEEWTLLNRTRRIWGVYDNARQTMHAEAQRYWPSGPDQRDQR